MKPSISRLRFNAAVGILRTSLRATLLREMAQPRNLDTGTWEDNFHQENFGPGREVLFHPGIIMGVGENTRLSCGGGW